MNLKKIVAFFVLSVFFILPSFVFASDPDDLEIDSGKTILYSFKGGNPYNDSITYNTVNIGAGTKVVLDAEWQYVFDSTKDETIYVKREAVNPEDPSSEEYVVDEIHTTTYTYRKDEILATLSIAKNGKLILNAGSELSLRNQYNLVTSTQDASLEYIKAYNKDGDEYGELKGGGYSNIDTLYGYVSKDDDGNVRTYWDKMLKGDIASEDLFTGDIVFESGDSDTILTFQKITEKISKDYPLPKETVEEIAGPTPSGGIRYERESIYDASVDAKERYSNKATFTNNFIANSNRAVFNVESGTEEQKKEWNDNESCTKLIGIDFGQDSTLTGDGCVVKRGEGTLVLGYEKDTKTGEERKLDATGLTGKNNNGCGWIVENGRLVTHVQANLGYSDVYISGGFLTFMTPGLGAETFENNVTFSGKGGAISLATFTDVILDGSIYTDKKTGGAATFNFYRYSNIMLNGTNDADAFYILFGGEEGGENNSIITSVDGLAKNLISATNMTKKELAEYASFELIVNENEDKEYSGSLEGELYLRKTGTGIVTLSGENTFTQGTYITNGGLLLANSNAIGTGNIWFDGGVKGDTTTYSSLGVSAGGDVSLTNNIHVKNGAVLNVLENQNMRMLGDLVSYDARPGYETEFIKLGLGEATISGALDADRQINISTFTVKDGGFVLDKNIVLNSYFSLDGQNAYLKINEDAGVKNNVIDIYSGDLIMFDENCISSATAINFYNTETSTEAFSKFHTMSTTTISNDTIAGNINIAGNIEFVSDATTTAKLNKFNFAAGNNLSIVKSGEGTFIADKDSGNFNVSDLYISDGIFRLDNTNMEASGTTIIDGGILSVSSTSHFASTVEKKITVLDGGGIGIYDANSIDSNTALNFEGEDEQNLSKLVIESSGVVLGNNIYVKTGLIIENEQDFTFAGYSDKSTAGILAKAGAGTMTIESEEFTMRELRSLEGNLLIKSDINILDSISVLGENAVISFENANNANISNRISLASGGTLSLSTSTVNVANLDLSSANIIINKSSKLNSTNVNFDSSTINLTDVSSVIEAATINLANGSTIEGFGNLNATVRAKDSSNIYVGSGGNTGEKLKMKNVVFESGSNLYIDVDSENETSDLLEVTGDITVQKNSTLYVNFINENAGDGSVALAGGNSDAPKKFKFLTFTGNYSFDNTTNEIFDIILSNPRYSASTFLLGKDIYLQLAQEWVAYDMPGVTKNQKEMMDVFNKIYADDIAKENMKHVLSALDAIYQDYRSTGNKVQFLNALQDLSGIFYSNAFMTSTMFSKANIIYNRINDYSKEREEENKIWAQVYTNNFSVAENEENPKFENSMYGMIAGYDSMIEDNMLWGIAGFYGQGELKQLEDKADVIDAGVNVYGDYKVNENIDVKGLIGYSMQDYDTTRKLRFIKQEIKSKFATNTISLDLEAAYRYDLNEKLSLKPLVGANCAIVSNGDIEEDGDTEQRLKIHKDSYTRADVRVGVGLQSKAVSPFNWYVSAAVKHIVVGDQFTTKSSFINAPDYEFEIESTKLASTSFVGNLGCAYDISSSFNVSLDLNADTGSASGFGANIGATYRW